VPIFRCRVSGQDQPTPAQRAGASRGDRGAAEEAAAEPDDPDAQAALRLQIRKILEADPALAAELARLVETAGPKYRSGSFTASVKVCYNLAAKGDPLEERPDESDPSRHPGGLPPRAPCVG